MAEIFKNIQGIHNNGEASVDIGIDQKKITVSRDNSDNSVTIKNSDNSLAELKVSEVILNNEKVSETYARKQELVDGLGDKVDKVNGKGLSANDYTNEDKTKLNSIEAGAEVNVQSDLFENDTTSDAYVKNRIFGYYNETRTNVFPLTTLSKDRASNNWYGVYDLGLDYNMSNQTTYIVTFDGIEYICPMRIIGGSYYVGGLTEYPFELYTHVTEVGDYQIYVSDESVDHTLQIDLLEQAPVKLISDWIESATPDKHASAHAVDGSDPITPASIGAATETHAAQHGSDGSDPITPNMIGLGNVDNTSDADKPVSTAQATAIADAKKAGTDAQGSIDSHAANVNNPHNVTAKQLGLDNVVNESKATMFTSPEFTGTPTAPTAASGTNNTQVATTAFVQAEIDKKIAAADAMIYKGTIGSSGATVTALPNTHSVGWSYKVATAGTYAGVKCEIGDMIVCIADGTAANNAHWSVIQSNIDGAVTGPASSVDSHVAVFDGATGKIIKDSGLTIGVSVPADAKFTDTTYSDVNASDSGLMTPVMLNKLNNISDSADAVSFAQTISDGTELGTITINGTPYKIYAPASISGNAATATSATQATQDSKGQNIADTYIKGISANGQTITITFGDGDTTTINTQDTTYNNASSSSAGLMSAADFAKLITIAEGAEVNVQADWNENDSSSDSYINNRTHWIDSEFGVAVEYDGIFINRKYQYVSVGFPDTTSVSLGNSDRVVITLTHEGSTETFDFVLTSMDAQYHPTGANVPFLAGGDLKNFNYDLPETDYGYYVYYDISEKYFDIYYSGRTFVYSNSDVVACKVECNTTTYHKLDKRFIPDQNDASATESGLMSAADYTKLQNIADGATANLGTITGVSINGTNIATDGVANIPAASTTVAGAVQLSTATNDSSTTTAATPSAVKAAYDLATNKEDSSNKVTSITSDSTDAQFPSAKAVYSLFESGNKTSLTYEVVSETSDIIVS